LKFDQLMHMLQ